ncbi:hypothetical protein AVEN_135301-1, partial [Araneus ventricosus]
RPGQLNDSRCNSSSTEAGVLVPITRPWPDPFRKRLSRTITGGGTRSPTITMPTGEMSSCLLIRQLLIRGFAVPLSRWEKKKEIEKKL